METHTTTLRKLEDFVFNEIPSPDLDDETLQWIVVNYVPRQENLKIVNNFKENCFGNLLNSSPTRAVTALIQILQNCKKNNFLLLSTNNVNSMIQRAKQSLSPDDFQQIQDYCDENHLFNLDCTQIPQNNPDLYKACSAYPYLAGFARVTHVVSNEPLSRYTSQSYQAIRMMKQYLTAKARVHKPIVKVQTPIVVCKESVFDWLPKELMNSIFALLDAKTLSIAGNVSKMWLEMSRNGMLWRNIIDAQVLSENKGMWDPLMGLSDLELKLMYLKWFVPFWNEAEHLKKFQWVEIAISAIDGSNFKEISIFMDVIGIASDIIHSASPKYVPQQRLMKTHQKLYSVLIKMCLACTDEQSQIKLETILFALVNSETREYHPLLFEQITKTKNYQRFVPHADNMLKTMCLKHKLSKARDVVDWISHDPEFLGELIKNDAIQGIDKPQTVLTFILEEMDALATLDPSVRSAYMSTKQVAEFLSKMPDIWLKNSFPSFVLKRPKNNVFIPELLKQLQELLDPKLASYKAIHEVLVRYDDAEVHKKLQKVKEPDEIIEDNSRNSCIVS